MKKFSQYFKEEAAMVYDISFLAMGDNGEGGCVVVKNIQFSDVNPTIASIDRDGNINYFVDDVSDKNIKQIESYAMNLGFTK